MALIIRTKRYVSFNYNFTRDGGATGTIVMGVTLDPLVCIGKIICQTYTALTSGGSATIAIISQNNTILAATAYTAFPGANAASDMQGTTFSLTANLTTGAVTGTINNNVDVITTNQYGNVAITIAGAALTAGAFDIILETYDQPIN